jgi:hypothetical protein
MRRRLFLALPLCLALASVCGAGIPTNRFNIVLTIPGDKDERKKDLFLAADRGRLTLGESTFGNVGDTEDAVDRWYIDGTRIKSSVGGYLAYDPTGGDNRLYLADRPGAGTEWLVTVPGKGERDQGERASIRVASGPMKGWCLAVEDVAERRADGRTVTVRHPVLTRDPKRRLEVERIWHHK